MTNCPYRLYDDRLAQLEQELELLRRQTCKHPEYLAQLRCITDRRDERSHYETTLRNYKHSIYNVRMHAEHSQTQSQYVQTAREVRDRALESCGRQLYQLQKGRRQLGAADTQYTQMYQPKRTLQVQRHNAYNLEVSILSGVAKYVGFPAAPEVLGIESADVEDDFQQMKVRMLLQVGLSSRNTSLT